MPIMPILLHNWRRNLAALAALALTTACGRSPTPDYERTRTVELRAYLAASGKGDHALALKKLERLRAWSDSSSAFDLLEASARENLIIGKANEALDQGRPAKALEIIDESLQTDGLSQRLEDARRGVVSLQQVQRYCQLQPFGDSAAAAAAIAKLPAPAIFGRQRPPYVAWLRGQRRIVGRWLARDQKRLVEELLREIDVAMVRRDFYAPVLFGELGGLDPQHPVYRTWAHSESPGSNELAAELAAFLAIADGRAAAVGRMKELFDGRPAASMMGQYARTYAALAAGERGRGARQLRELLERVPRLDAAPLVRAMRLGGAPSGSPTPTISGVLGVFYGAEKLD